MDIPIFNLPAEKTCRNPTELCRKYCYAKKAEKLWVVSLNSRMENWHCADGTSGYKFVEEMVKEIKNRNKQYFRIHESGDFYNQEYLNKWFEIARQLPGIQFLCYTNSWDLDWSNMPENLVRYWSVWPDSVGVPRDGLKAYVIDNGKGIIRGSTGESGKVCAKETQGIKCNQCLYCFKAKGNVRFKIH